jgi:hypothetical protein
MLDDLRFRIQLWRLQRTRDRIEKSYTYKLHHAFKNKLSRDEKERLIAAKQMDLEECDDDINSLTTGYLLAQARKLFIEIPQRNEGYWFDSTTFGGRYLTHAGITKLRSEIRNERKASWEVFQTRMSLLITLATLLIGVLGAVIGVLSFLKKSTH